MKKYVKTFGLYVPALVLVAPLYASCWWLMLKHVPKLAMAYEAAGISNLPSCLGFAVESWHGLHYRPWFALTLLLAIALFEWLCRCNRKCLVRKCCIFTATLFSMAYLSFICLCVATGAYFFIFERDTILETQTEFVEQGHSVYPR